MDRSGKVIRNISSAEFGQWFRSSRLILLAVMAVFIHVQIVLPLAECARLMEKKVTVLEGFLALGNSGVILLVLPILFLVMMADVPQKTGLHIFYQVRCRKRIWVGGQILFAIRASLLVEIFLLIITCILMSECGTWQMHYSDAVTHFMSVYPERSGDYIVQLVPGNLYQQIPMPVALVHSLFLMFLHFLLIAMINLFSTLCGKKYMGILINGFLIILGAVTCEVKMKVMWIFPLAHMIPWLHYEEYLSRMIFPMWASYLYLMCACGGLMILCVIFAKKCQMLE